MINTVSYRFDNDKKILFLKIIDQRKLPERLDYIVTADLQQIYDAIKTLAVRGAPAIGIAAALGLTAASSNYKDMPSAKFVEKLKKDADFLDSSRPTAVNLSWALGRCLRKVADSAKMSYSTEKLWDVLFKEAQAIRDEDIKMCRKIGENGAVLFDRLGMNVLTHCNAGSLATGGCGTALAPVYVATEQGKHPEVFADETRPLLQGARLTSWELSEEQIPVTVICDGAAATVLKSKKIDLVIVGADRIAANGDVANKIGTYGLAVCAKYHKIPFYVAAPYSTFDLTLSSGEKIKIEERSADELRSFSGRDIIPDKAMVFNPAFDVTPYSLITGIITEKGIFSPPF
ncbi:MAG: S-methyl-5-thioribose-1-phosphate isomerase [Verrucomicrobiota bacterium]|nr:S-methyl-5-thioribose-1-phosphate isomerase [Verrucomicrobiota bacterium]